MDKYLQEIEPKIAKLRQTITPTQDENQLLDELLDCLKSISSLSMAAAPEPVTGVVTRPWALTHELMTASRPPLANGRQSFNNMI